MSIHCPDCGAVAGYGHELGHKRDCPSLSREPRKTLADGTQIYPGHRAIIKDGAYAGQQEGYVVLAEEERAKGFVRPVRRSYKHLKCGVVTTMGQTLAETYAHDPFFYSGTFCCQCCGHFPVGENGEFVWDGTSEKVGT
jgi:hypothetical protein